MANQNVLDVTILASNGSTSIPLTMSTHPQNLPLEIVYRITSNVEFVPIAKDEGYDFVIEMESLLSLEDGWKIRMTNETEEYSTKDVPVSLRIVGILGHYSKGKSFVVNRLHAEFKQSAMSSISSVSWLQPYYTALENTLKTYTPGIQHTDSNHSDLRAKEAPGVTTKGISGLFFRHDSVHLNDSLMLLLDTAGRNAPARGTSNSINVMHENIFDLRSKEGLIDDMILEIVDTIVYVLDEVLNEDQRTILHILEHIVVKRTDQKLVIIHNFKRISCRDHEAASTLLQEQVHRSFDASFQFRGKNILSSSWRLEVDDKEYDVEVYHVVLFDQNHCADQNGEVLNALSRILANNKRSHARVGKLFDIFAQSATKHVDKFVKLTQIPKEPSKRKDAKHTQEDEERRCVGHCFRLKDISSYVELLHWEKRALPAASSLEEYVPKSNTYRTETGFSIRVDLPGLDGYISWNEAQLEAYRKTPKDSHCNESWAAVTVDNRDEHYRSFHVVGCRSRPKGDTSNEFGNFDVRFQVPYFYCCPRTNLSKGELNIALDRTN